MKIEIDIPFQQGTNPREEIHFAVQKFVDDLVPFYRPIPNEGNIKTISGRTVGTYKITFGG